MSFLPTFLHPLTASTLFFKLYAAIVPVSIEACDTKEIDVVGTKVFFRSVRTYLCSMEWNQHTEYIGLIMIGSTVGIDAFGSPCDTRVLEREDLQRLRMTKLLTICICDIMPPLITMVGFVPKFAGVHRTKSANLPTSTLPIK